MGLVQKKHALRNISTASNRSQSRSAIEPSIDPSAAMSAERTGYLALVRFSVRPNELPDLCQAQCSQRVR
jgi:hypothetical protein